MEKEEQSFEEKIEKAKELLEKLSNPQITLSDSLELYKNGIKELEEAQKLLDEAKLIFTTEEKKDILDNIDTANMTEEEFLNMAVEKVGEIKKTKNKTLQKDSFIKIFKLTGEFAKMRSKEVKKVG